MKTVLLMLELSVNYSHQCETLSNWSVLMVDCSLQKARANEMQLRLTLEQAKEQERQALYD